MWFEIVATGQGMMEPGEIVGNIQAKNHAAAVKAIEEFLGGRPMIWVIREIEK